MRKLHNINADLFKHTPTFIQKHVTNHEKILKKQSQIDPKSFQKSIEFNPWVVLGRFRRHFALRSAPGRARSLGGIDF